MFFEKHIQTIERNKKNFQNIENSKILLTGGTGYIGKNLLDFLIALNNYYNFEVHSLSRDPKKFLVKNPQYKLNYLKFIHGDTQTVKNENYDYVLHFALSNPDKYDNLLETHNIISILKNSNIKKIFFSSSGAVYGFDSPEFVDENYIGENLNSYGQNKIEIEKILNNSGIPTVCGRIFGVIGPYLPLDSHFAVGNFINSALKESKIIINGAGKNQRTYLSTFDLVGWIMQLLLTENVTGAYNIGSEKNISIYNLACLISKELGNISIEVKRKNSTSLAANNYIPSIEKLKNTLMVKEYISLKESISHTTSWVLENLK